MKWCSFCVYTVSCPGPFYQAKVGGGRQAEDEEEEEVEGLRAGDESRSMRRKSKDSLQGVEGVQQYQYEDDDQMMLFDDEPALPRGDEDEQLHHHQLPEDQEESKEKVRKEWVGTAFLVLW